MRRILFVLLAFVVGLQFATPTFAASDGGAVYAMTNAYNESGNGNQIVAYKRAADGTLTAIGTFNTNGNGKTTEPDDALGSQNPLILSPNRAWLFAVNAGSNSISVFHVEENGITFVEVVPSGGDFPASLTMHGNLLYVLNAGGDGNITGFTVGGNGHLTPLAGSTRSLNAGGSNPPFFLVSPAQVGFNPVGDKLVVTVKGVHPVHQIHVFAVDGNGLPSAQPVTTTSNHILSFGFVFDDLNNLIVAEPFGNSLGPDGNGNDVPPPVPNRSAASSYRIAADGTLQPISGSILNGQTATCWIAITTNTRFAYTTNNVSGTISSYKVSADGSLSLINAVAAAPGHAPVDLAITGNNQYLYNVNAGDGTVSMFKINQADGSLIALGSIAGLPGDGSAVGIAAY